MTVDGSFYSVPSPIAHLLVAAMRHVMVQCLLGAMGQSESLSELNFLGIEKWENIKLSLVVISASVSGGLEWSVERLSHQSLGYDFSGATRIKEAIIGGFP